MAHVDAVMSPVRRTRRTPKPRKPFDKRTLLGRRVVALAAVFCARLGEAASDPVLQVQIERAARLVAYSELISAKALRADPRVSPDDVIRASRASDHAMRRLRLDRHETPPQQPSLASYLAANGEDAS